MENQFNEIELYNSDMTDIDPIPDFDFNSIDEGVILPSGKIKICVDGEGRSDNGFKMTPYFKVYQESTFISSDKKKRNRIYLFGNAYIDHTIHPGKWKLNKSELDQLQKILLSPPQNIVKSLRGIECINIWQQILALSNLEGNMQGTIYELPLNYPMPHYNEGYMLDVPSNEMKAYAKQIRGI